MNKRLIATAPLFVSLFAAIGCGSAPMAEEASAGSSSEAVTACPAPSVTDDQQRAAATVAFNIMRAAAKVGGAVLPYYSNTVLASQRYRVLSTGTGIEFDPTDSLYAYVSSAMKAELLFAQQDAAVAKFLSDGLKLAYATSDGWNFPSFGSVASLANFSYPGPTTVHVGDPFSQNDSHYATVSGQAWCGTSKVLISETVQQSYSYSPLFSASITNPNGVNPSPWLTKPPAAFKGTKRIPTTPFNGPLASGNPYLIISVNGVTTNWATYNFTPVSCWGMGPNNQCSGTIEVDPVPYAEPGDYYNMVGMVGTQSNPFTLDGSILFADPTHATQWATRTTNGTQEWGQFSQAITLAGITRYRYVKKM
jgi:hypothetical protein